MQEVRRGSDKAEIYSICFDKQSQWIACSSDKGTIHIFTVSKNTQRIQLGDEEEKEEEEPREDTVPTGDAKKPKNSKHV